MMLQLRTLVLCNLINVCQASVPMRLPSEPEGLISNLHNQGSNMRGRHERDNASTRTTQRQGNPPSSRSRGNDTSPMREVKSTEPVATAPLIGTARSRRGPGSSHRTASPISSRKEQKEHAFAPGRTSDTCRTARSLSTCADTLSVDTPRETSRTTTTSGMSTARAEATLVALEAERAQLECRLKKVEEELEKEDALTRMEARRDSRRRKPLHEPRRRRKEHASSSS